MKKLLFMLLCFSLIGKNITAQDRDTLKVKGNFSLMGSWQTGNLNQIGISPQGHLEIKNKRFENTFSVNYNYLEVEGFKILNDLWLTNTLKLKSEKAFYPMLAVIYGSAHSFKIDQTLVSGVGGGWVLFKKEDHSYLDISAFVGYMNFRFDSELSHQAASAGTFLEFKYPLNDLIDFLWEFKSYHSLEEKEYWGANNRFTISTKLRSKLHLNITHNLLYNDKVMSDVEKYNTQTLLGLAYKF